ncbi:hypothetical protein ACOMHN_003215 [Nucella lapillus]
MASFVPINRWIHGYSGQALFYIDDDILCHQCGKYIKFMKEDGAESVFLFPGKGVGPIAVHKVAKKLAIAEDCLQPKIYVYGYPVMEQLAVFEDGAKIEFQKVEFSYADHLLSLSGIPDYVLIIWDYKKGEKLASVNFPHEPCTSAAFSPVNWRQICVTTKCSLTLLHVEQNDDVFSLHLQNVKLPSETGTIYEDSINNFDEKSTSQLAKFRTTTSSSAIAGCSGESSDFFAKLEDSTVRISPVAQAWTPYGDIFISSDKGHLAKDGAVHLFDVSKDRAVLVNSCKTPFPASTLTFSYDYLQIAVGSSHGAIFMVKVDNLSSVNTVTSIHFGEIVGMGTLKTNNDVCVVTCLACSPLMGYVAVGTTGGHVYFVDFSDQRNPHIVHRNYLYTGPVRALAFDEDGQYLFTGGKDGNVFVVNGRPSLSFSPIGYVGTNGSARKITTVNYDSQVKVGVLVFIFGEPKQLPKTYLVCFDITPTLIAEGEKNYKNATREFLSTAINKVTFDLDMIPRSIALARDGQAFVVCTLTGQIHTYSIPKEVEQKDENNIVPLKSKSYVTGSQFPQGELLISPHRGWLTSYSPDGAITLRPVLSKKDTLTVYPFSHKSGGVRHVVFSLDCTDMLAAGAGGLICSYKWTWVSCGASMESARRQLLTYCAVRVERVREILNGEDQVLSDMGIWRPPDLPSRSVSTEQQEKKAWIKQQKKEAFDNEQIFESPPPSPNPVSTWLQDRQFEVLEVEQKQYADKKKRIREELLNIRLKLIAMEKENDQQNELEQLDHTEFHLDIDLQAEWQQEEENEVDNFYETALFKNLVTNAHAELIKRECWDKMMVKGRSIKAFNSELSVANFPLKEQSQTFLNKLDIATRRRNIELREAEMNNADDEENQQRKHPSMFGSLGSQCGGDSDMFYSQFELHQRHQKIYQITLTEDALYRIKMAFNKEFEGLQLRKEQEVARFKDKNKRIAQIFKSLDRADTVVQPDFILSEKPESLFVVLDHEIEAEKILTEAQKRQLEREEREQEERQRLEKKDNMRMRALETMMGGALEILREDELRKDIPIPPFMEDTTVDWTEEEKKLAKEYKAKVKELNQERETFRKQLVSELDKLQTWIDSTKASFDDSLNELYLKKILVTMAVGQEELKIVRLRRLLLVEDELLTTEKELHFKMSNKLDRKVGSGEIVLNCQDQLEAYRNDYEVVVAEDRLAERNFRREFCDLSHSAVDNLQKYFRKRPRVNRAKYQDAYLLYGKHPNPFWDYLSRQMMDTPEAQEAALDELDANVPEGHDAAIWQRLCNYRRTKINIEIMLKEKSHVLTNMQEFVYSRQAEDDALKNGIKHIRDQLLKLKEEQDLFNINLEVQLLMKQGQIEINPSELTPRYQDCLLVKRSRIDNINASIRRLGEEKIAHMELMKDYGKSIIQLKWVKSKLFTIHLSKTVHMEHSKDFGKSIIQLEWDHKKCTMEMDDVQEKLRTIQFMKVTREVQAYLTESDYEGKKAKDISMMEQTIALQRQCHSRVMAKKQRSLADIRRAMKHRADDYMVQNVSLTQLNVLTNEYRHISDVMELYNTERGDTEDRYQQLVRRAQLVEQARRQAQEIAALRAEMLRLRMRTFPSF